MVLEWLDLPRVPHDIKRHVAEIAWGKSVIHTRKEHWDAVANCECRQRVLADACKAGHLAVAQWLHANGAPYIRDAMNSACLGGQLDAAKWAFDNGATSLLAPHDKACEGGHLHVVQWIESKGFKDRRWGAQTASKHGHLELVKWFVSEVEKQPFAEMEGRCACFGEQQLHCGCVPDVDGPLTCAAWGGHLHVATWARARGATRIDDAMCLACSRGHLSFAKWARKEGAGGDLVMDNCIHDALKGGHFTTAKWLIGEGATLDEQCLFLACEKAPLALLKVLIDGVNVALLRLLDGCLHIMRPDVRQFLQDSFNIK